jgi:hypothetical protein
MNMKLSIIIPAFNEEKYLPTTLSSLDKIRFWDEIVVVDDGSIDQTSSIPLPEGVRMIRHEKNMGKGSALITGVQNSNGDLLLFLDADLGETAPLGRYLIDPVQAGTADMTIAKFPSAGKEGGFGLVKGFASWGIKKLTGVRISEPLSGQRCLHRKVAQTISNYHVGYGIEVAMNIDAIRAGYRLQEIELPFSHRALGRTWKGFLHRGKELSHIINILRRKR